MSASPVTDGAKGGRAGAAEDALSPPTSPHQPSSGGGARFRQLLSSRPGSASAGEAEGPRPVPARAFGRSPEEPGAVWPCRTEGRQRTPAGETSGTGEVSAGSTLDDRPPGEEGLSGVTDAAMLAADLITLGGCSRRELPAPPPCSRPVAEGLDPATHRILVGVGPGGPEARVLLGAVPGNREILAGAEIHLRLGPRGLEATVLTPVASSRQTLVTAMEEVARRLRQKGHLLHLRRGPRPEHDS